MAALPAMADFSLSPPASWSMFGCGEDEGLSLWTIAAEGAEGTFSGVAGVGLLSAETHKPKRE